MKDDELLLIVEPGDFGELTTIMLFERLTDGTHVVLELISTTNPIAMWCEQVLDLAELHGLTEIRVVTYNSGQMAVACLEAARARRERSY